MPVMADPMPPFARRVPGSARDESGARGAARGADRSPAALARRRARLVALAQLLDNRWKLPGTKFRFGLDAVIGLLPAGGDAVMAVVSLYIVAEAWRLGATKGQIARMLANVGIEALVGAVPVVGDLFDAGFKANVRNLRIMGIDASRE
jgi:hypothetical protein